MSHPVKEWKNGKAAHVSAHRAGNRVNRYVSEMLPNSKGYPNLVSIKFVHVGDAEDNNVCINGADHHSFNYNISLHMLCQKGKQFCFVFILSEETSFWKVFRDQQLVAGCLVLVCLLCLASDCLENTHPTQRQDVPQIVLGRQHTVVHEYISGIILKGLGLSRRHHVDNSD